MLQRFIPTVMVYISCLVVTASPAGALRHSSSDTLFQDHFQDSSSTLSKWVFDANVTRTFSAGALNLANKDTTYLWFVTHSDTVASKTAIFTLSATIKLASSASNAVGIAFCMTNYDGISVQIGTGQNLLVYKYDTDVQQLAGSINSFISPTVNTIKVSKRDSTFNVFCNGHYITTFYVSDPKFINGGDIGLVLPPKAQATFDDVVMTKLYETGAPISCFSEEFSNGTMDGWYTGTIAGSAQEVNGMLTLTNSDAQMSSLTFISGSFDRASLRVITSHKSGGGLYGLALVFPVSVTGGTSYRTYSFLIDSLRHYGYGHPDSASIKLSPSKSYIHGATGDGKDTLEILRFNTKYSFRINGTVAEDSLPLRGNGQIEAAGLFVMPQTSVAFDNFIIGGDSAGASCAVIAFANKFKTTISAGLLTQGNIIMVFDASGRLLKRLTPPYSGNLPQLPAGIYFLRQRDKVSISVQGMGTIKRY